MGIQVVREPRDYEWGARAACLRDPDGTCIWLLRRWPSARPLSGTFSAAGL